MTAITEPIREAVSVRTPYSRTRLTAGLLGRCWLWFLAACLAITIAPMLFGWGSFVVVTGSMEPSIRGGDVVLVSPGFDRNHIVGHVVTFEDPTRADHVLTHRVVTVNDDGTLVTRGDANLTADSAPVEPASVIGTGRLLVQFVGLPVVWVRESNWVPLALHLLLVIGAAVATARDHEPPLRGPTLRARIAQHQPADPTKIWKRAAPSITVALILVIGTAVAAQPRSIGVSEAAFTSASSNTADLWAIPNWSYSGSIIGLGPYLYWRLDETGTATTAADSSGNGRTGTYNQSGTTTYFTRLSDGAMTTDTPDRAVHLNSIDSCINTASATAVAGPQVFTVIAWFRAPATYTDGGKLIGFERPQSGVLTPTAGAYDRQLYLDGNGRIWFGVYNNAHVTLSSAAGLNDGGWHMAVGTQSAAGMRLYVDGALVGSNANTVAETQTGWWRAGCGNLAGWGANWGGSNNPGTDAGVTQNRAFRGDLDEVTVFTTALTAQDVAFLYWSR